MGTPRLPPDRDASHELAVLIFNDPEPWMLGILGDTARLRHIEEYGYISEALLSTNLL
ncbi:hypothetical protein [Methylorubrum extorquens]